MKKKLTSLVLTSMLAMTTLVGCGGNTSTETTQQQASEDGLKIAIVTSITGVDDGNFNENNYEGILEFIENNPGSTVNAIQEPSGDTTAAVQAVNDDSTKELKLEDFFFFNKPGFTQMNKMHNQE